MQWLVRTPLQSQRFLLEGCDFTLFHFLAMLNDSNTKDNSMIDKRVSLLLLAILDDKLLLYMDTL